ncbi:MAG: hypothetical protein EON60_13000 [Alphaproteobacteria bacterium]|nr:MAG: hypothetical protein EON60_13000 [Alphaproteobacteria bacterium]
MTKTVLNYTYTGTLRIVIDNDAEAMHKYSCTMKGELVGRQEGYPVAPDEEMAVFTLTDKQFDFRDDPLGYYLYLSYAGSPPNCDPLQSQRNLLNRLHRVKNEVKPLPRWKRWVIEMLDLAPVT